MLRSYGYFCLNLEISRLDSCLDNIITNFRREDVDYQVTHPHVSDHLGIMLNINKYSRPHTDNNSVKGQDAINTFRLINESSVNSFKVMLNNINWFSLIIPLNFVHDGFELFMQILQYWFDICCPIQSKLKEPNVKSEGRHHCVDKK